MASLNVRKSGTNVSSWDYYIKDHAEWLTTPLVAEKDGLLRDGDGVVLTRFDRGSDIQIQNLSLESVRGRLRAWVKIGNLIGWTSPANISKPTTRQGPRTQEHQEYWVNNAINESVTYRSGSVNIMVGSVPAGTYVSSHKADGHNKLGHEKYADLVWTTTSDEGSVDVGVSMKIGTPPSIFGGGYLGLHSLDPGYIEHVSKKAFALASRDSRFEINSHKKLTDIYVLITDASIKRKAFVGNEDMGGPVRYMFVGTEEPRYTLCGSDLTFPTSKLYTADTYYQKTPRVYIRIRRRNATDVFTDRVGPDGNPLIFGRGSGKGHQRARYVCSEEAPPDSLILDDT